MLLCAIAAVGLIIASSLVLDWFDASIAGIGRLRIGLHTVKICARNGWCASASMGTLTGLYPAMSEAAMWSSLILAAIVAFQTGMRLTGREPHEKLVRVGLGIALLSFCAAVAAGYVSGPQPGSNADLTVTLDRTLAPVLLLLGDVLAVLALFMSASEDPLPDVAAPPASARVYVPPPAPAPARPRVADSIPLDTPAAPPATVPRVRYAAAAAELSSAGIEAHLDAGIARRVAWAEVVGLVVRRLPPEAPFDGAPFVDIVSAPGATVRILPSTRLLGVTITGPDRTRALVQALAAHCPGAKLDAATRAFVDGERAALQLPDVAMLAAHDERMA